MATTEFEFTPLSEARAAAEEAKPIGVDDDAYSAIVDALEKHLSTVAPEMTRAKVRIEQYADAQEAVQVLRVSVKPDAPKEEDN